jgi:DNA end-binding protein Ku
VARPFWSGRIQISLVSFGVKLFPATEAKSEIRFHQISRGSGARVRHQKVSSEDDEPVENHDLVMGYEYTKGQYIQIEPEEIQRLRAASRHTLEIQQFVDIDELDPGLFEKPYFVLPENDTQAEAFAVVRQALQQTAKFGLGQVALSGREHLIALGATAGDRPVGMMAYTLRYAAELRSSAEYFAEVKTPSVDEEQLALAKELIKRRTAPLDLSRFKDQYEIALHELIDAKLKNLPIPKEEMPAKHAKVVNLMDALRKSVSTTKRQPDDRGSDRLPAKKPPVKAGPKLVHSRAGSAAKRKSA